ncbi:MAG TPA: rod shape-determining protein MreC [Salinivirgaceae bacterium]|nr:rod shape-determining protein MreC [Salinivirgaceae bacterium]
MRNLIRLIQQYHLIILFLVLEFFAFLILVTHNPYQRSEFTSFALSITGSLFEKIEKVHNYLNLAKNNERLARENAQLKNSLLLSFKSNQITYKELRDSVLQRNWTFIDCNIIFNSTNKQQNILIVDRGTKHGVTQEMGIMTEKGVIGIIQTASLNYSNALSLLNTQVSISAKLKKTNHVGILRWDGSSTKYCYLYDLPNHLTINNGDTIVTSGYSTLFPPGVPIGFVEDFDSGENPNFFRIKVHLFEDFGSLSTAYIVKNHFKTEIEKLKINPTND